MAKWCLIPELAEKFKRGLIDGSINPGTLNSMTSPQRREFFAKSFGEENAKNINANFESTLLLKNQEIGMVRWAEKIIGLRPDVKRGILEKIRGLDKALNPEEEKSFLTDLVAKRLGIDMEVEQAKTLSDLSKKVSELEVKADKEGKFPTETDRFEYGASKVALENYFNELKLQAREGVYNKNILDKIKNTVVDLPGAMKSVVASMDNSFWGRQGINTLLDLRTSKIWVRNFLKSWGDIKNQVLAKGRFYTSGDNAVLDAIKADIYSRPNAVTGKYKAGGYGLNVFTEEAYPSSLPEKIPLLGRLFKASEVAYNGGALRMRADLADRYIKLAEKQGVNTLNPDEAKPIGHLIGSITGRGSLGKAETLSKEINTWAFSIKFLKANVDILTAGMSDSKVRNNPYARKEAAKNLLSIVATLTSVLVIAKALNPDSVESDPRSTNFGKIKIFGKYVDITGGKAGIITMVSRLATGKSKSATGEITDLNDPKFGARNKLDVLYSFLEGKLSPMAGILRDFLKNEMFGGEEFTLENILKRQLPLPVQNYSEIVNDPTSEFPLGSIILDGLGFSTVSYLEPNAKTKIIPLDTKISEGDFLKAITVYAEAFGTDPETAFNRLFTGQKIIKVSDGGIIVVERNDVAMSEAEKKAFVKKYGGNTKEIKLDHTIPLALGGAEDEKNRKVVSTAVWSSYTKVENALIQGVKNGTIKLKDAQAEILKFKDIQDASDRKKYGENLINQVKKKTSSFRLVKDAYAAEGLEKKSEKLTDEQNALKRKVGLIKFVDGIKKFFGKNEEDRSSGALTAKRQRYNTMLKLREEDFGWYKENISQADEKVLLGGMDLNTHNLSQDSTGELVLTEELNNIKETKTIPTATPTPIKTITTEAKEKLLPTITKNWPDKVPYLEEAKKIWKGVDPHKVVNVLFGESYLKNSINANVSNGKGKIVPLPLPMPKDREEWTQLRAKYPSIDVGISKINTNTAMTNYLESKGLTYYDLIVDPELNLQIGYDLYSGKIPRTAPGWGNWYAARNLGYDKKSE